jgi:hypothetical protein
LACAEDEDAAAEHILDDGVPKFGKAFARGLIPDEFDAEHESESADVADVGILPRQGFHPLEHLAADSGGVGDESGLEQFDGRERGFDSDGVASNA